MASAQSTTTHISLLKTLVRMYSLLSVGPYMHPLASLMRSDEGAADAVAFALVDAVPKCKDAVQKSDKALSEALEEAIETYSS